MENNELILTPQQRFRNEKRHVDFVPSAISLVRATTRYFHTTIKFLKKNR